MTKSEIKTAQKLLADRAERFGVMGTDSGKLCLSVQWIGGGQRIFYTLEEVQNKLAEIAARS